jgi:hypothetical protein
MAVEREWQREKERVSCGGSCHLAQDGRHVLQDYLSACRQPAILADNGMQPQRVYFWPKVSTYPNAIQVCTPSFPAKPVDALELCPFA